MKLPVSIVSAIMLPPVVSLASETLDIKIAGQDVIRYQQAPMTNPAGGDRFKVSNFIHPLRTPSGFIVTDLQPRDHMHHLGLWWPWKHVETQGRQILFWELQQGDGIIQAQGAEATEAGFSANSIYLDRKAPEVPSTLINETLDAKVSVLVEEPARGYFLDLAITHRSAVGHPITVTPYRYSGFAIRGASFWKNKNSTLLTDAGKDRDTSNFTRARWVRLEGSNGSGGTAGILLMSHPGNFDYPETLRTWDSKQHDGAFFINFNSVYEKPWTFEPGQPYTRRYRVFVYDGTVSPEQAEALHRQYALQA